jgi:RNA polymerase sigma factor (sigma-70 family)
VSRPFRYTFILAVVALATALAAVGGWRYARASAPVNGPIILVSVDSLRADRLPAYGNHRIETPAFDTLAKDGVVFERAYSHSPQTLPAHVAMLTGQLPFETGMRDGAGFIVKAETRLLAEMLRDRGEVIDIRCPWVANHTMRAETKLSTWLFGIARNVARESLRARARANSHVDLADRSVMDLSDNKPVPVDRLLSKELNELIRRSLAALDEDKRLVFTLKVLHQCSYEEIAAILGTSVGAAKVRVHRARLRLASTRNPDEGKP